MSCRDLIFSDTCRDYTGCDREHCCEENGKKYRIYNEDKKDIRVYRVECLIDSGRRCDKLVLNCRDSVAYFVELKGTDLDEAVDQLGASIDQLKRRIDGWTIYARVVMSRVKAPAYQNNKYQKLDKLLRENHNGSLRVRNHEYPEYI